VPPAGLVTPCSLFSISAIPSTTKTVSGVVTTVTDRFLQHTAGVNPSQAWNQDPVVGTTVFPGNVSTDVSYPSGSYLINLGKLIDRTYRLDTATHVLMIDTFDSTVATTSPTAPTSSTELFPNVASLQAIYGLDSNGDHMVDSWSNTVPTKTVGVDVVPAWEQVFAVRIAVVIRSAQPEKEKVTLVEPVWHRDGINAENIPVSDISKTDPEAWMHYRYKVFETVVPLRNMLWQS
jgi:type IV pilus assembly protein PilW